MKTLIVEDDFTSRLLLQELLRSYGPSHVAVNGEEAIAAVRAALELNEPYDLVCLDIMMPEMDGHQALREIKALEEQYGQSTARGTKVIMTTALGGRNVFEAFREQCDAYLIKPIEKSKLIGSLHKLDLIDDAGKA